MIVISGALVLVALVLLIIGLVSTSLPFVYASIAVSVVSFVFLLVGILQRRNEQLPGDGAEGAAPTTTPASDAEVDGVTAIIPASRRPLDEPSAADEQAPALVGDVLVVTGRPRYHVSGCRYLTGKEPEELPVQAAREQGFTACGVCKPDAALAEEAAAQPHPQPDDEPVAAPAEAPVSLRKESAAGPPPVEPAPVPDPVTAARKTTRAKPTQQPGRTPAVSATKAPAKATAATKAPATKAPAKKPAATKAPAKAAPAKSAPAKSAPAKSAGRTAGSVVVIPDRGKFHTPDCRFVRGVSGTQELSRAQATRQGYDACGVCKP